MLEWVGRLCGRLRNVRLWGFRSLASFVLHIVGSGLIVVMSMESLMGCGYASRLICVDRCGSGVNKWLSNRDLHSKCSNLF